MFCNHIIISPHTQQLNPGVNGIYGQPCERELNIQLSWVAGTDDDTVPNVPTSIQHIAFIIKYDWPRMAGPNEI